MWTPTGLERFLVYSGGFAVVCLLFYWLRRDLLLPTLGVMAAAYTVAITGWRPLAAIALFAAGSYGVGNAIIRHAHRWLGATVAATAVPAILATGAGFWLLVWNLLAYTPWNFSWVYAVPLAIAAATQIRRVPLRFSPPYWPAALLAYVFGAQWLMCLKPEVGADGIAMHLAIPMHLARWHQWHFDVTRTSWAVMPMGADWCYSALYAMGGEYGAKLLPLYFLGVTLALIFVMCRRWVSTSVALLFASAYAAIPLVQLTTGSLYGENLLTLLLLAAVCFIVNGQLAIAGMLLGAALNVKFGALAFALACAVWILWAGRRSSKQLALSAIFFLALACPPYLTAFRATGNPVFPFLNTVFRSPYFDTTTNNPDPRFAQPLSWRTPYDLTFHTSRFLEGEDGALGLLVLFCVLLAVVTKDWRLLAVAAVYSIATLRAAPYARYLLPAVPLVLIAAASTLARLQEVDWRLYAAASSLIIVLTLAGLCLFPSGGYWHRDFCLHPLHFASEAAAYVEQHAPSRILVNYLNREAPGQAVAFLTNGIAGLEAPSYIVGWHDFPFYSEVTRARTAEGVESLMKAKGIRFFIACLPPCDPPLPAPLKEHLKKRTHERMRAGGAYIAELTPPQ